MAEWQELRRDGEDERRKYAELIKQIQAVS